MRASTLLFLMACLGCGNRPTSRPLPTSATGPAKGPPPASVAQPPAKPRLGSKLAPLAYGYPEVHAFVDSWLADQNRGDFAAYAKRYAPSFAGTRRSGKQTRTFTLAGWLADRGRMFKAPMQVTAADRVVTLSPQGAHVRFVQTFASGQYRDVGRKVMRLAWDGKQLAIVNERMLASQRLPPAGTQPASNGRPMLYVENGVAWFDTPLSAKAKASRGKAELIQGDLPRVEPDCDPMPDYETDDLNYSRSYDADPDNYVADYIAAARLTDVPITIAHWLGRPLKVWSANGASCDAVLDEARAIGRWTTVAGSLDASAPGESVLNYNPHAGSFVPPNCKGEIATDATQTPRVWRLGVVPPGLLQSAYAMLYNFLDTQEGYIDLEGWLIESTDTSRSPSLVFVTAREDCMGGHDGFVLLSISGSAAAPTLTLLAGDAEPLTPRAAFTVGKQTFPTIIVNHGFLEPRVDGGYAYVEVAPFPTDQLSQCGE